MALLERLAGAIATVVSGKDFPVRESAISIPEDRDFSDRGSGIDQLRRAVQAGIIQRGDLLRIGESNEDANPYVFDDFVYMPEGKVYLQCSFVDSEQTFQGLVFLFIPYWERVLVKQKEK